MTLAEWEKEDRYLRHQLRSAERIAEGTHQPALRAERDRVVRLYDRLVAEHSTKRPK